MRLYVGNLPFKATDETIREHFSAHGEVAEVAIVLEKGSQRSRGFGFVTMADEAGGKAAIAALDGQPFDGRNLIVNEARPREEQSSAPRREYGGGGGGDRRPRRDFGGGGGGGGRRDFGGGGGGRDDRRPRRNFGGGRR